MTLNEARAILIEADPKRFYGITKELDYFGRIGVFTEQEKRTEKYSIAIQPGEGGEQCTIYFGKSIDECLTKCLAYIKPTPSTGNDE